VAGCLKHRGRVGEADIQACLLLIVTTVCLEHRASVRRVTTIARAHDVAVTELRPVAERWDALDLLDRELISFLWDTLGGAGALSLADLQAGARSRPDTFKAGLRRWQQSVLRRAEQLGLSESGSLTDAGRSELERLRAFERYLHDFGTLGDEPAIAVELWGPYLAWAVAFGLGDRVARELGIDTPGVAADPDLAVWKAWFGLD
jgi:hypothetical protein